VKQKLNRQERLQSRLVQMQTEVDPAYAEIKEERIFKH
jgi:hypothetical protein